MIVADEINFSIKMHVNYMELFVIKTALSKLLA